MVTVKHAVVHPPVLVVLEEAEHNWAAYAPGVPGCIAVGDTAEAAQRNIEDALRSHFEFERLNDADDCNDTRDLRVTAQGTLERSEEKHKARS